MKAVEGDQFFDGRTLSASDRMVFGRIAHGDQGNHLVRPGKVERFLGGSGVEPTDPTRANAQLCGLENKVLPRNPDVNKVVGGSLESSPDAVGEEVYFGEEDNQRWCLLDKADRAIDSRAYPGTKAVFDGRIIQHNEPPGLNVLGGGGQTGGFDALEDLLPFDRAVCIAPNAAALADQSEE